MKSFAEFLNERFINAIDIQTNMKTASTPEIINLILSQIRLRDKRINDGYFATHYSMMGDLLEHSFIHIGTMRQSGSTTAMKSLFDHEKDLLITNRMTDIKSIFPNNIADINHLPLTRVKFDPTTGNIVCDWLMGKRIENAKIWIDLGSNMAIRRSNKVIALMYHIERMCNRGNIPNLYIAF